MFVHWRKKAVFEENSRTSEAQEWLEDTQDYNTNNTKDLIIIESDEEDIEAAYYTISETKKIRTFLNKSNEFQLELIQTEEGHLIGIAIFLDITCFQKLTQLLPNIHVHEHHNTWAY